MDRRSLAQDLRRWAVEEMGLSPQRAPSEEMLQRLFIGQCADIWKYVIRHVRSERTVRNIEGNLLWYQQLQHSEAQRSAKEKEQQRRAQLSRDILQLRTELHHLQEQIQSAEKEVVRQELGNHKSQDLQQRLLLIRAYLRKKMDECDVLRDQNRQVEVSCAKLQNTGRASQGWVRFPELDEESAFLSFPEPSVLRDVRESCQIRLQYLRSLHEDVASGGHGRDDLRESADQLWMSELAKIWDLYPPNHVVASLKHLAAESTRDLMRLQPREAEDPVETPASTADTASNLQETQENPAPFGSNRPVSGDAASGNALPNAVLVVPPFDGLLQSSWKETKNVWTELRNVQVQLETLSGRMAEKLQEVRRTLTEGSEVSDLSRAAFDLELRLVLLRGCRTALLEQCRLLQEKAAEKSPDMMLLQKRQQNIHDAKHLLNTKQKQIQALIVGAATCRGKIRDQRLEVQRFLQERLSPRPHELQQETRRLQDFVVKDLKHFSSIFLPILQKVCTDGTTLVPALDLSINRVSNPRSPYYSAYKAIYTSVGLPLYKAPQAVLLHVAEMKRRRHFLRSQLSSRRRVVEKLKLQFSKSPDTNTDVLLRLLSVHYAQQTEELVPRLQQLAQQCRQSQEYGKEVQAVVSDWWEQPAQLCLPQEERGGQTLRQWQDRWTVAVTALQRATGSHS